MEKTITIGDFTGLIINNKELKKNIIDYLYQIINLSNLRYNILDNVQKLQYLQENEHYVMPNYKGTTYLLIFTNIMNKNYSILINRKKLSYHYSQVVLNNVLLVDIQIITNNNMYLGTIFNGKIIHKDDKHFFLIQDCFYLLGKNILNMEMLQKINYLNDIININLPKNCCNNFIFKLNKLYKYIDLPNLINTIIPTGKFSSNGLIFYPYKSGNSIIYIEKKDNNSINKKIEITNSIDASYNLIDNYTNILKSREYSYEKDTKYTIFYIAKTTIPDVYNLYNNINTEFNKIGIAHIPNLKISHYCYNNIGIDPIKIYCIYYSKFDKWIPIKLVN